MKTQKTIEFLDEIRNYIENEENSGGLDGGDERWNPALLAAKDKLSKYKDLKKEVKRLRKENESLKAENAKASIREELEDFIM